MIRFTNVSKAYKGGGRPALQGINFQQKGK